MTDLYVWYAVLVIAIVTAIIRFLPFIVFNGARKTPPVVEKFGRVLPSAIMGMLVVYCLKDVSFKSVAGFLPQLIACAVTGIIHVWKRNTLISIISGTVCYMILVQMIF